MRSPMRIAMNAWRSAACAVLLLVLECVAGGELAGARRIRETVSRGTECGSIPRALARHG